MKPVQFMGFVIKLGSTSNTGVVRFRIYRAGKLIDSAGFLCDARQKIRALQAKGTT